MKKFCGRGFARKYKDHLRRRGAFWKGERQMVPIADSSIPIRRESRLNLRGELIKKLKMKLPKDGTSYFSACRRSLIERRMRAELYAKINREYTPRYR